ncbi:MAG: Unknown protein, partial [uncultured Sulfurovum sp.]
LEITSPPIGRDTPLKWAFEQRTLLKKTKQSHVKELVLWVLDHFLQKKFANLHD